MWIERTFYFKGQNFRVYEISRTFQILRRLRNLIPAKLYLFGINDIQYPNN